MSGFRIKLCTSRNQLFRPRLRPERHMFKFHQRLLIVTWSSASVFTQLTMIYIERLLLEPTDYIVIFEAFRNGRESGFMKGNGWIYHHMKPFIYRVYRPTPPSSIPRETVPLFTPYSPRGSPIVHGQIYLLVHQYVDGVHCVHIFEYIHSCGLRSLKRRQT